MYKIVYTYLNGLPGRVDTGARQKNFIKNRKDGGRMPRTTSDIDSRLDSHPPDVENGVEGRRWLRKMMDSE